MNRICKSLPSNSVMPLYPAVSNKPSLILSLSIPRIAKTSVHCVVAELRKSPSMATIKTLKNPSLLSHLLSLSSSPKKNVPRNPHPTSPPTLLLFFFSLLIFSTLFIISVAGILPLNTRYQSPCPMMISPSSSPSPLLLASLSSVFSDTIDDEPRLSHSAMLPLPPHGVVGNVSEDERQFWKQPDGQGFRPCLDFGLEYRKASAKISKEKKRFLVVVVSGGLNQQRNQIVDAVVIARILEAALVVPVLQINRVWRGESEFSEIFDVEHFKRTLKADVRVVSSLPATHLVSKQLTGNQIPSRASPAWVRARFLKQLHQEGVLVLKGLDSKLSKNLNPDLQKLRCKVAFHALRFSAPIRELGNRIARRMWIEGPYVAIHLRLEKDVWIRTGCLTGLGPEYDNIIKNERGSHPELLTGKLNISHVHRRRSGLCPLNASEVARLLKALGAPGNARIYVAGGEPFGGRKALKALEAEFPNLVTKETLDRDGELKQYTNRSSVLAAIDYVVSLSSDVFLPSHGGNMARALQGHRAYVGHRKYIKPNKRALVRLFGERSVSDAEVILREMHMKSRGQPEARRNMRNRDVIAYPVPECMCKN